MNGFIQFQTVPMNRCRLSHLEGNSVSRGKIGVDGIETGAHQQVCC